MGKLEEQYIVDSKGRRRVIHIRKADPENMKDKKEAQVMDPGDRKKVIALLAKYKGKQIPDSEVHQLAKEMGVDIDSMESFIYGLASKHVSETE